MFSLIITIISIALVAALALATLYYGGSAFNRGSDAADAARLINEGQQINGAVAIAKADAAAAGVSALGTLDALTTASPAYLSQLPASFASAGATVIPTTGAGVVSKEVTDGVCAEVNKRGGHTAATATDAASWAPVGAYGCDTVAAKSTFFYKF